jgi:Domain of unknown function (DUF1932)
VEQSHFLLSIVPPRDALSIADRVSSALKIAARRSSPLYFLDLNATSPLTAQKVLARFSELKEACRVIDGGIISGPPVLKALDGSEPSWDKPSIVISGPDTLGSAPNNGAELASVLNAKHVHKDIGPATGLKMVFASMNKGFTAMCIQAMTTAQQLGVLPELQAHLKEYSPLIGKKAEIGLPGMCPKAYRWVAEMDEIAETMQVFGGFQARDSSGARGQGGDLFTSISEIFKFVADDTPLGQERIEHRQLGKTAAEVSQICAENLKPKEKFVD